MILIGAKTMPATPIADKLLARMKRQRRGRFVDLYVAAEELQGGLVIPERLARHHPAHAAYLYAQNQVSVMSEQLTGLNELASFVRILSAAEDLYIPTGPAPPMSPLTASYYTCWAFFDVCAGPAKETIGDIILKIGAALGIPEDLLHVIRLMQRSRMGIYRHEGIEGSLIVLRELATDVVSRAVCGSQYDGRKGELWYARVLPPPFPDGSEHIVFTTPYVLLQPGLPEWRAYFRRVLPTGPQQTHIAAYEHHMKYGPTRNYWPEFVFEGYVNYQTEAIFLAGLPDIPESLPHSKHQWDSQ